MSVFDAFGLKSPNNLSKVRLTFDRFGNLGSLKVRVAILSHHIIFPLLTGFLFDLPWGNQVLISLVLVGAVFIVRDFSEVLLLLWLALAIIGFLLVLWCIGFDSDVNNLLLAISVLSMWFVLLIGKSRKISMLNFGPKLNLGLDGFAIFVYLYTNLPRGRLQNLGFLYQEDNQRSLNAIVQSLNNGSTDLGLLSTNDTLGMPFFVKFVTSFVSKMGLISSDQIPLRAVNVLSNSWMFLLLSYLILGSSFCKWLFCYLNSCNSFFGRFFCLLSMIWGFQVSHGAGYFPLFLLNTIVIVTICLFRTVKIDGSSVRLFLFLTGVSLTCAMFGSWQPWIPTAGGIFLIVLYKILGRNLLRKLLHGVIVRSIVALFSTLLLVRFILDLTRVDLESSGREHFPTEVLLVLAGLFVIMIGTSFRTFFYPSYALDRYSDVRSQLSYIVVPVAAFVIAFVYILSLHPNQSRTLFFLVVVGLVFNRYSIRSISKSSQKLLSNELTDATVVFALLTFSYVVVVFLLSRFIGPTYEPMYASDKTSVAFYSQFYWLPVSLLAVPIKVVDKLKSSLIQKLSVFAFCSLLAIPASITYDPVQEKWWHKPVTDSLARDAYLPIVCSFPTEFSEDRETWVCTHFMEVLNDEKFIDLLWFQQWQSIGPRPVDLSLARKYLVEESTFEKILVLSCSVLDQGMMDFFGSVNKSRVVFKIQEPCDR